MAEENTVPDKSVDANKPKSRDKTKASHSRSETKSANSPMESGRPSVVPLSYADKDDLHKAYMPYVKGGGLFIPTGNPYPMNEEIFLLVTLPGSKKPLPVAGKVVWTAPAGVGGTMKQGVGVEFKGREGNSLRNTIEGMLGARISSTDDTFTM